MTTVLGISCHTHDSAACLMQDGKVVAAAQEERFNRKEGTQDFPIQAINSCIKESGATFYDIDYVGFYELPYYKFYRVILNHLASWPKSFRSFYASMPSWFQERLVLPMVLAEQFGYRKKVYFVPHHMSHAASSFLVSPYDEAAIIISDSVGEWASLSCGTGRGEKVTLQSELRYPNSVGLAFMAVTSYLGFRPNRDEPEVMRLAAFGKPQFHDAFHKIIRPRNDGGFDVDPSYFEFNSGPKLYSKKFVAIFGPPRTEGEPLTEKHRDLAASLQECVECALLNVVKKLQRETSLENLCLAGDSFLNYNLNRRIVEESGFKRIFVQPAAGDAGGALGAAAFIHNCLLKHPRNFVMEDAFLGPHYPVRKIQAHLEATGTKYRFMPDDELYSLVAAKLAEDKVVGWFQGRMEFGPQSFGNRFVLARLDTQHSRFNDAFPLPAIVLPEDAAAKYFAAELRAPFARIAARVGNDTKALLGSANLPGDTAWIRTVSPGTAPRMCGLLSAVEKTSGAPLVLGSPFCLRGEPMVCQPSDALTSFVNGPIDLLIMENFVVEKGDCAA